MKNCVITLIMISFLVCPAWARDTQNKKNVKTGETDVAGKAASKTTAQTTLAGKCGAVQGIYCG